MKLYSLDDIDRMIADNELKHGARFEVVGDLDGGAVVRLIEATAGVNHDSLAPYSALIAAPYATPPKPATIRDVFEYTADLLNAAGYSARVDRIGNYFRLSAQHAAQWCHTEGYVETYTRNAVKAASTLVNMVGIVANSYSAGIMQPSNITRRIAGRFCPAHPPEI